MKISKEYKNSIGYYKIIIGPKVYAYVIKDNEWFVRPRELATNIQKEIPRLFNVLYSKQE